MFENGKLPALGGGRREEDAGNILRRTHREGGAQFFGSISGNTLTVGSEATVYSNGMAELKLDASRPLGGTGLGATFSNFQVPAGNTFPSDAVIVGIYPVMVGTYWQGGFTQYA